MAFYKRSTFLIDSKFQIRIGLIVCSIIFISSLIYPIILIDFFDQVVATNPQITNNVLTARNDLIYFLFIIQLLFTALVFIVFIFITHKIAGPIFKLKSHLARIRQGEAISPLTFRDGDYFKDLAEEVSLFLETIKSNQEKDFEYIEEVSQLISNLSVVIPEDKKAIINDVSRRLLDIQDRYKKNL